MLPSHVRKLPILQIADLQHEIAHSVEATLTQEARRNELALARIRTWVFGMAVFVNLFLMATGWGAYAHVQVPWTPFGAFVLAFVLWKALCKGGYRPWFRWYLPLIDVIVVFAMFNDVLTRIPQVPLLNVGGACVLLVMTGGVRLSRLPVAITTVGALAIDTGLTLLYGEWGPHVLQSGVIILGAGLLGLWTTDIVRRAMQREVGQAILARFLPNQVVAAAYEDPLNLIQDARALDVTVVMTDLRGFTRMAEELDPAKVLAVLNHIQGKLAEIVRQHGGTVDKFMGDGMLAVFGAPEPLEDHAARAMQAAEAMLGALRDEPLQLGIGIHSGRVVAGCLGSGLRLEFTVIGDTVNTAARLESMTKEHGVPVLIGEETVRQSGHAGVVEMGETPIRGKAQSIKIYGLVRPE